MSLFRIRSQRQGTLNLIQNKQEEKNIFSPKKKASLHPIVQPNNKGADSIKIQKHLGMMLDLKLSYEDNNKSVSNKVKRLASWENFNQFSPDEL